MGESIGNITAKELKNIESRLERGIGRIRSKKVNMDQKAATRYKVIPLESLKPS
jgi:hypothetical protein